MTSDYNQAIARGLRAEIAKIARQIAADQKKILDSKDEEIERLRSQGEAKANKIRNLQDENRDLVRMNIEAEDRIKSATWAVLDFNTGNDAGCPAYYLGKTGRAAWEEITEYGLGYELGCAWKYIVRAGRKTADPTEDLRKAINCIQRFIELSKNGEKR